jgi:HSP20 family protein
MKLIPRRDTGEVASFRNEFDDLFSRFFDVDVQNKLPQAFSRAGVPLTNVAETDKNWMVSVELPGLNEKDISVQLLGDDLQITAERKWEEEKKGKEFHRVESQYGSLQRSIRLPNYVRHEADAIVASYKKGMLEITIPKVEPTPTAKIPVKAG